MTRLKLNKNEDEISPIITLFATCKDCLDKGWDATQQDLRIEAVQHSDNEYNIFVSVEDHVKEHHEDIDET